ncbi:hypothetical protein AVEN_121572-1, partial [Araneus ventricosus]
MLWWIASSSKLSHGSDNRPFLESEGRATLSLFMNMRYCRFLKDIRLYQVIVQRCFGGSPPPPNLAMGPTIGHFLKVKDVL